MTTPSTCPAISICVPTYNGATFLPHCFDSILAQTYGDFEVVVVDDCSRDETGCILDGYAARDERFRIFRNPQNVGLVGNWNQCIGRTRGKWIKFLFQDDWLAPDCLRRMVEDAAGTGSLLTVCRREFAYEEIPDEFRRRYPEIGGELSPADAYPGRGLISAAEFCAAVLDRGMQNFVGEPTATLIHRDAIAIFGVFNPRLVQLCDFEYWLRVGVNQGISYLPETLAYFRVHADSTTFHNFRDLSFQGDIIDPLLIKCDLAYSPLYQPLRNAARSRGLDLRAEFKRACVLEQTSGNECANPGWRQVLAMEPRLRMPWQVRARRLVTKLLEMVT